LTGAEATGTGPRLPFLLGAMPGNTRVFRETQVTAFMPRSASVGFYDVAERAVPAQKDSAFFLDKYLYPPALLQGFRYQASSNDGLMGRATDAASRIFWTRDESGARRLNTSYFLRVATWIAADTASRPYWKRSGMAPISDFGSTIGNDAGMNLFHEFGPDLGQALSSHLPKFVSRILVEQNSRNSSAKTGSTTLTQ